MKKSNRIARKSATAPSRAQAKRPAASPAKSTGVPGKKNAPSLVLPCHRLAPRTPAQTRELQAFTANLGTHLATCVFARGDVQHLFKKTQFIMVTETLNVPWPRGKVFGLSETLWEFRLLLADFVKRRPLVSFGRLFDFETLPREEIALWAEENGVAERLPLAVRRDLWGDDEAEGRTKGLLVLSTVRTSDRGGRERIYNRCGSFTLENEETGEAKPITREDVVFRLGNFVVLPLLDSKLPPGLRDEFHLEARESRDADYPAEPADILG